MSETLKMPKYFDTNWSKDRDASKPGYSGTLPVFPEPNKTNTFVHLKLRTKEVSAVVCGVELVKSYIPFDSEDNQIVCSIISASEIDLTQ